jgi:hypothetical protein
MLYSLRLINVACLDGRQLFVPMRHLYSIPLDCALHPRAISFNVRQMRDAIRSTFDLGTRVYEKTAADQIAGLALALASLALIT